MNDLSLAASLVSPVAAGGAVLYYACSWPTSQLLGPALVRGPADGRRVALTFDDGPAEPFTGQILDILRDERVPATFFCCGKNVERFPKLVRRMEAEGHAVGNHTYSHPLFYLKRRAVIETELDRTQDVIQGVIGHLPRLFRPPYGVRWFGLFPALRQRGLTNVQWSDTGYDWITRYSPAEMARKALARLAPGAVILLHDGREPRAPGEIDASATVAALPAILEGARAAGFSFVPLEQFLPPS
jgi:peptidoglycan/xylan/chitin deacetylase (PgdA/CDA1 family)